MATLNGKIMLFGGFAPGVIDDDTWVWDGASWSQASPTSHPSGRQSAAAATLNGKC